MTSEGSVVPGLPDDLLTHSARPRDARGWLRDAVDRLVGADPGLNQLRTALQATIGIGVGLGLAYVFVRLTGALQAPRGTAPPKVLQGEDHAMLLVSMLLAGMVAMQTTFSVQEPTVVGQVLSSLLFPVPLVAALVLGLLVAPHRVGSLAFVVTAMTLAVYLRRFGQRGFGAGMAVFFGSFFSLFLHTQIDLGDAGWVAADLEVGAVASLVVRLTFFRPDPEKALARMRSSQRARARRLLELSAGVLRDEDQQGIARLEERIRRQLVRLNETTLVIDAQLANTHPETVEEEAQRSFDAELALSNCARFAGALAARKASRPVRHGAASALSALVDDDRSAAIQAAADLRAVPCDNDRVAVLVSRFAASVEHYAHARDRLGQPVDARESQPDADSDFAPAVQLANGWLPGSTPVSTAASTSPGRGPFGHAAMPPYLRSTIQIAVAGSIAAVVGDVVSGQRLYWGVLTVFVCFLRASNSGEYLQRAFYRASGTAIGIVIGDLLVHATGGRVWATVLIVLVAMFFGVYLIRVNYTFMTIAVTVMIAQLYVQLGELSWHVLLLRLAETAVGVAAVVLTVLVVLPLRPQRVLGTGLLLWFQALRGLVDAVLGRLDGPREPLRPLVRQLDAAYAALVPTVASVPRVAWGRTSSEVSELLAVSSAVRLYARSLASVVEAGEAAGEELPAVDTPALRAAADQLRESLDAIEHRLTTGEQARYVRSSSLDALALDDLRRRHSRFADGVHDLTRLDGALARLATLLQMDVTDRDTDEQVGAVLGRV